MTTVTAHPSLLSIAELSAARLDGELFDVSDDYASVAEPETIQLRARSLASWVPPQAAVERHSALWVYGVLARPPTPLQLCLGAHSTLRIATTRRYIVREVALLVGDVRTFADVQVTSPLRTAVDLSRTSDVFDQHLIRQLAELIRPERLTIADFERRLSASRNLPHKKLALARLRLVVEAAFCRADEGSVSRR
ncbi:hypothetical protein [Subtercola lobariae]|uniref:AbiEi antitoxin C-terminal domain-containing protein n=1 Tax=Subtercola lobariae TaxID=1588641 RepID=A0A917EY72_9MICO|nr:hypothetical protein [Subtercola lobariae]GGF23578.1 hypothetical protein GCM10011399_16470 [Subtercola lobariae]